MKVSDASARHSKRGLAVITALVPILYLLNYGQVVRAAKDPAAPTVALISPKNGATGVAVNATLRWRGVKNAASYEVFLFRPGPDGSANACPPPSPIPFLVREATVTTTTYTPGLLAGSTRYCWSVDLVEYGEFTTGPGADPGMHTIEYSIPTPTSRPTGIASDFPCGTAWFTESASGKIGHLTTQDFFHSPWWTGAGSSSLIATLASTAPSTGFTLNEFSTPTLNSGPYAITQGPDSAMWFTESLGNKIGRITSCGSSVPGVITEYPIPTPLSSPSGIAADFSGAWFTENLGNKIGRITPAGVITEYPTPTLGSAPYAITAGGWFTENSANKIGVITTDGAITEYPIPTPASNPQGITLGPDGAVWFTESSANKIGKITSTGQITEYPIPTPGAQPQAITRGPDGALWFTEPGASQIGRISIAGKITEYKTATSGSGPFGITIGPTMPSELNNTEFWFVEYLTNKLAVAWPL